MKPEEDREKGTAAGAAGACGSAGEETGAETMTAQKMGRENSAGKAGNETEKTPAPLLTVKNLAVSIDTWRGEVQAVRGVSFTLNAGEALVLVGESGCGKSKTAETILRLNPDRNIRIKSGEIYLDGHDIVHADEKEMEEIRGKTAGMIFQDPLTSLNPTMRVGRQLGESMHKHTSLSRREIRQKVVDMLTAVRIPEAPKRAREYPTQFSGGMRQRAMTGLAIANIPKLLIADEPTTALDVTIQAQILDLLKSIQKTENMAILLITHDLGVAAAAAQKIAIMYAGKILEYGSAREIYEQPRHPYTIGLLKSVPRPDQPRTEDLYSIPGAPPALIDPPVGCPFADRCAQCMRICRQRMPEETELTATHGCSCWLLTREEMSRAAGKEVPV